MSAIDDLDILQTQSSILEKVARDEPLHDILESLCHAIESTMNEQGVCSVMELHGDVLRLVTAPSGDEHWREWVSSVPVGKGSCGLAIARGESIFIENTEVADSWSGFEAVIETLNIHSCWSVPIRQASGGLRGTFAISQSTCGLPSRRQAMILENAAWLAGIAFDRDEIKRENALMMNELNHRVKNNLAVVLALVKHVSRRADSMDDFIDSLSGRIRSMALAHETLAESSWEDVGLEMLMDRLIGAYNIGTEQRVDASGPDVLLEASVAAPLGMVIHEFLTNAAKHGALSSEAGHVTISWDVRDGDLHLQLIESGGPGVEFPFEPGVGYDIIRGVIERQLRGSIEFNDGAEGFSVSLSVPVESADS